MTFLALVATAADSEKGREGIGDALRNTAIKNDASPKECTVSKAIKPEYEHNRFAYGRLSALLQAGKQIQQNGAGNSQRCFCHFFSPSEALIRLYLSYICLSISAFLSQTPISIADIMLQTRPNIHADGPNLNFRSHVFRTVREVNRHPDVQVQRPVAVVVGGWMGL